MLFYLLKSTICLLLFWGFYKLFLEQEKMFVFNRFFLLGSVALSFIIPLITIEITGNPTADITNEIILFESNNSAIEKEINTINWSVIVSSIYATIVLILLFRLVYNISKIIATARQSAIVKWKNTTLVFIKKQQLPHAFLNFIFINKNDFENGKIETALLKHELEHIRQRHSYDVIFIEILKAIFWFNPLFHLFEKAIKLNHEFLADNGVIEQSEDIRSYQYLLLQKASSTTKNSYLASNINYLITKKRLEMMTKKTSKMRVMTKTILSVALCFMMCFVFSNKVMAQNKGVSDALMEEYKTLAEKYDVKDGEAVIIKKKDVKRLNKIYAQMSEEQRKSLPKLNIPPPPPAPPVPPVPHSAPIPPVPPVPPVPAIPAPPKAPKAPKAVKPVKAPKAKVKKESEEN